MKSFTRVKFVALLIGLVIFLWITSGLTQTSGTIDSEVIITIAGEEYHYLPQPEFGYVIKIRQEDTNSNESLQVSSEAMLLPENTKPIGGLDRRGIWVFENKQSDEQEQNTRMLFSNQSQYQYIAPLFTSNGETIAIIPEIVVCVEPGTIVEQVQTLCDIVGCSIIKPMEFTTQEYLLEVLGPDADAVFTVVEQLNQISIVEWAAPNTAFQPKLNGQFVSRSFANDELLLTDASVQDANEFGVCPNDEYFFMQWHLYNTGQSYGTPGVDIHAPEAWKITTGDPNIVVAVVDSGVDMNHPDLINNLVSGYDFFEDDNLPDPSLDHWFNAHGTICAGLIAAQGNNNLGVSGVTWNCKIMPIRISSIDSQLEEFFVTQSDIATSLRWAASNGADILSNSWGYYKPTPIIHSAIIDITELGGIGRGGKGCIIFVAAGNDGASLSWPERYHEVIAVSATDHNDLRWYYSNKGPELDVVAPSGGNSSEDFFVNMVRDWVWTTDICGVSGFSELHIVNDIYTEILDYAAGSGTSSACPIAAGITALILSIEPDLTNEEVRHFLERSAKDLGDPGRDDYYGWGRVDARAALDMVLAKRCDLNNNWKVDVDDFLILLDCWDRNDLSGDIAPAAKRDGIVDINDFELFLQYWQTEIPEPNLFAHWKLDETEGDIACDSSGYYHDANLIGDPNWQPEGGMIDGALEFDGIDDYINTPFVLNPADGPFSVSAWIKGDLPGQVILSQANGVNWLSTNADGNLMTGMGSGRGAELISELVITDGDWHRIGFSWDGDNRILYVDDIIVDEDTRKNGLPSSEDGLYIGAGNDLDSGTLWFGMIDDVRIYDRVITP